MGINLFLVKSRNSTIQDLFLFVFTQDILHYQILHELGLFHCKRTTKFMSINDKSLNILSFVTK
ncbi:hypothetical protein WA05_05495 [Streptococcus agalactiae]|nr:hypothetical protein SAG0034_05405 [Streptococcus agalactiae FSL S3-170]KLL30174.1 hypothetical protein WA02_10855 [Streptococcus agalactiae]KLL84180.1 hypothetical protein WA05_05495 [Streptococcus agalactiae]